MEQSEVTLNPGPELDALIAEKVMGLEPWPIQIFSQKAFTAPRLHPGQFARPCESPSYSTDIAAAWKVVEKVDLFGYHVVPGWESYGPVYRTLCKVKGEWMISDDRSLGWEVRAPTAPHAICLAALKAVSG